MSEKNIIEFEVKNKPKIKQGFKKKCEIIQFPYLKEYIEIFEKYRAKSFKVKHILRSFQYVNQKIEDIAETAIFEKKIPAIVNFVKHFENNYMHLEGVWEGIHNGYEEEPICLHIANLVKQEKFMEKGYSYYGCFPEELKFEVNSIVDFIISDLLDPTLLHFYNKKTETCCIIEIPKHDEIKTSIEINDLSLQILASFCSLIVETGIVIVSEIMENNEQTISGFICNEYGITPIEPQDLQKQLEKEFAEKEFKTTYTKYDIPE